MPAVDKPRAVGKMPSPLWLALPPRRVEGEGRAAGGKGGESRRLLGWLRLRVRCP